MDDNPAERLAKMWGGTRPMARDLSVNASLVHRWVRRYREVPREWRGRVMAAARVRGFDEAAVTACLPSPVCECCGREIHE